VGSGGDRGRFSNRIEHHFLVNNMNDLRLPTGIFFSILGLILLIYAAIRPDLRPAMTQVNVNLWSGLTLLIFGGVLLWLSRRAKR
jgi:Na+/melibiose symporter-like transporter